MNHIDLKNKTIFVTGSAGFIGSNLVLELLKTQSPINIVGLDNMNDYYDVNIKEWRLQEIKKCVSEHPESGTVIHTWKYMIMYIPVSCHVLFAPFLSLFIHFPYIHTKLW